MRTEFMVVMVLLSPSRSLVAEEITRQRERWNKGKQSSYLANGHIWAPYCSARSKWVFARPRVLIAAIGAAAEDASPCQTMLRGYLRLLGDGWPSSQRLPHRYRGLPFVWPPSTAAARRIFGGTVISGLLQLHFLFAMCCEAWNAAKRCKYQFQCATNNCIV
jgi:hypothetical protein